MSMKDNKPLEQNEEKETVTEATGEATEASAEPQAERGAQKKELEAKEAELAEAKDKYLRMMAEYDNFRKRSAKERDGI